MVPPTNSCGRSLGLGWFLRQQLVEVGQDGLRIDAMHLRTVLDGFHGYAHTAGAPHAVGREDVTSSRIGLDRLKDRHVLRKDGSLLSQCQRDLLPPVFYPTAPRGPGPLPPPGDPLSHTTPLRHTIALSPRATEDRKERQMSKICVICGKKPGFGN